jgi:kumamolisin
MPRLRRAAFALVLAAALGTAPAAGASQPMSEIVLGLERDRAAIAADVRAVSDPASPSYGDYRSLAEVAAEHGATPATRTAVLAYLRPRVSRAVVDPTGLFVRVRVTAAQAERVFGVKTEEVRPGVLVTQGFPRLPAALRPHVAEVEGLVDITQHAYGTGDTAMSIFGTGGTGGDGGSAGLFGARSADPDPPSPRVAPAEPGADAKRTGTARGCAEGVAAGGFTPNQLRTAYGFDRYGAKGQGRHIVLFESGENYDDSIVRDYARCFGLDMPSMRKVLVGSGPNPTKSANVEVLLDIQAVMGMLPELSQLTVLIGRDTAPYPAILAAGLDPARVGMRTPDAISVSYGICETALKGPFGRMTGRYPLWDDVAAYAAMMGVSVLVATGDSGSSGCLRQQQIAGSFGAAISESVAYPGASPMVTAVGGTSMALTRGNAIAKQRPWNTALYGSPGYLIFSEEPITIEGLTFFDPNASDALQNVGAGTGGTSTMARSPWYQSAAGGMRTVPDVAMFADEKPGFTVLGTGLQPGTLAFGSVGGTSLATPLAAAAIAAVNQRLAARGGHPIGFANPLIYGAAGAPVAQRPFRDIAVGNNDLAKIGCCVARPGYDRASGFGTLDVPALGRWAAGAQ